MIILKNISKEYDENVVLENVDLNIGNKDRIGLIGNNGVGKSTIFQIITGNVKPDTGYVEGNQSDIGYLPQNPTFEDLNVNEFINKHISHENFQEYQIEEALTNVGLENIDRLIMCNSLSGGQKTKLYIATLLLRDPKPEILLLDEPTNNLDINGLDWLDNFIKDYDGGVILTSHDRYFLDRVCNKIVELKDKHLKKYGGNYSFYVQQKQVEEQAYQKMYIVQQKQIKKTLENIKDAKKEATIYEDKFSSRQPYEKKKASKSVRNAIVKEEKLEKLLGSTEYLDKPKLTKKYGVDLLGSNPQGKLMLAVKDLNFSYGQKSLLKDISFEIFGSERAWILGKNGSGKTTLIKNILGKLQPISGEIKFGTNIKYGYFSQDASSLRNEYTGIDELTTVNNDTTECFRMSLHLHLTQEDLYKKIKHLSAGQRVKLEFTKLMLAQNNLIIMDEPTNHLEISTREEIETAIQEYRGAVLVVSHDRYFVDKLGINKIIEL